MIRAIFTFMIVTASASHAAATPCVSSTFDVPLPGATDVTSHVTDLPSSVFPAFWQEGRLGDYRYQIFANIAGVLRGDKQDEPWAIEITCDAATETCTFTPTGNPPEPATRTAERIGQCLVPTFPINDTSQVLEQTAQQPRSSEHESALEPETVNAPVPCGLAITNELTDVATLQRLLFLLGEDPGPVDGFLGPRSFFAMEAYVNNPGWSTPIPDLITELSEQHCALTQ